jgi:precorrin-2 dehydrogenase/sirohydrochlorin ferrochelatase
VKYYPAFLNLKDKKAVVVGGGRVAERKVRLLMRAGADVTLVSPEITIALRKLADRKLLHYIRGAYRKRHIRDAFVVIAGTSSPEINRKIAREAGQLVNVIDMPSEGNYIVPSLVKRGPLTIAISTEGASPAVSKAIRKEIEEQYSKEFSRYLKFIERVRKKAMKTIRNDEKRERFLKSLASEELLTTLRTRGFAAVQADLVSVLGRISDKKS